MKTNGKEHSFKILGLFSDDKRQKNKNEYWCSEEISGEKKKSYIPPFLELLVHI